MIQEAYVSFETAKLLKEKGFGEYTLGFYKDNEKKLDFDRFADDWNTKHVGYIAAPTHQMALKWLREVHNIYIMVEHNKLLTPPFWFKLDDYTSDSLYTTYEQACEDAIEYCLENKI